MVNYLIATTTSMLAASRQGYALARDGGLFWKTGCVAHMAFDLVEDTDMYDFRLTKIHPKLKVPHHSVNLVMVLTVLIGLV